MHWCHILLADYLITRCFSVYMNLLRWDKVVNDVQLAFFGLIDGSRRQSWASATLAPQRRHWLSSAHRRRRLQPVIVQSQTFRFSYAFVFVNVLVSVAKWFLFVKNAIPKASFNVCSEQTNEHEKLNKKNAENIRKVQECAKVVRAIIVVYGEMYLWKRDD